MSEQRDESINNQAISSEVDTYTGSKTTAHIISHTHWDREWYLPYEKHHMRLISLIDSLLDKLEQDPDYKSFYLDGQTIILLDYLQVRPEHKERLEQHIRNGRIFIGPWYILQDAFLTSGEANIRNMQIGHRDCERYGSPSKIGYFPDTFGLVGQTPQFMQQSGITNVFFGRGVKPTGFNNTVSDRGYESSFSELLWTGPDGSEVLGILFANWYSNGNEVPIDEAEAKMYWKRKLDDAQKYASTGELLFMNGCDHQPLQLDLPEAIRTAQKLYPDIKFVHSNFNDYLTSLKRTSQRQLSSVKGELRSQRTDGWGTLVNTASARVYLKQMNQLGQVMLEKVAEPLATIAHLLGQAYPHHLFTYAWKTLMQNHPHDSICGCSVDEVHREMVTRFDKSRHVAESIVDESIEVIVQAVDTTGFSRFGEDALPLAIFNTSGWERSGIVSAELEVVRLYFREEYTPEEAAHQAKNVDLSGRILVDSEGSPVACKMEDLGLQFGYDLPDDRFRQPYMSRRVRLTFEVERVPLLGLKTYAWLRSNVETDSSSLFHGSRSMENDLLHVEIADNGSFTLTDKRTGRSYKDLGVYENVGDIGNEYMFRQPEGEQALTTKDLIADIRVLEDTPFLASIEIIHHWGIPASADETLEQEQRELVYYPYRKAQRSWQTVPLTIRTVISLSRNSRGVSMETTFNNQAKDHRLRALFPTDIETGEHRVDSMFEIAIRDNKPAPEWENPSNTQHQQAFVDVSGEQKGLTVANLGLNEYEIMRDGRNTIAITLLRSVGELGDWGWFPTPEAQCPGEHTARLEIIPHDGDGIQSGAYTEAYQYQIPWIVKQTGIHAGTVASDYAPFDWQSTELAFSSMKMNELSGDVLLRWYNMSNSIAELIIKPGPQQYDFYKSNILEQPGEDIVVDSSNELLQSVKPHEIITLGFKLKT